MRVKEDTDQKKPMFWHILRRVAEPSLKPLQKILFTISNKNNKLMCGAFGITDAEITLKT